MAGVAGWNEGDPEPRWGRGPRAGELYAVAGLLGVTDQQVRLCIKRLVAEDRFTHEGRGRKASLKAVADVTGSITPNVAYVRHAYRQDHGLAAWDGVWHLFAFAIPESSRTSRDTLRHLGWLCSREESRFWLTFRGGLTECDARGMWWDGRTLLP